MTASAVSNSMPLCIDLDGTLIRTDLFFESLVALLKRKPWLLFMLPLWLLRGKAALKRNIARRVSIDPAALPYNSRLLQWLMREKAGRRELLLVTAADELLAGRVADHLGIFDRVISSDGRVNLKGRQKLLAIQRQLPGKFEYAGNSPADLEVWRHCDSAIVVGASPSLVRQVRRHVPDVTAFDAEPGFLKRYSAALRLHQWVKNVLIFIPLITSHQFLHIPLLLKGALSFILLGCCSSAQYILNDLADLDNDRRHAVKRHRPFASGEVPIAAGLVLAPVLLAFSIGTAMLLSMPLAAALAAYFAVSLSYSLKLKKIAILDTFVLAGLYMSRILAGGLVTGIPLSNWLLSFSFFLFLSLAFTKRWAELSALRHVSGNPAGRGYRAEDIGQVNLFGVCSAFLSAVVLLLYIQSDNVRALYREPQLLWLLSPVLLYWVSRLWLRSSRGEMSEDPVVFVLKDPVTWVVGAVSALIMILATAPWAGVR